MSINVEEKIPWHIYMKPFVLAAWIFLSAGIAFGSIWAYYELGWGGWWFWDPVENASFMPWLLGTALVHSLITVEKRKSLQSWVLLLSILSFLLSVIGTFLVRSGILTSVHTFALDPARGIYILTFVALLGGYSLILFGLKSKNFLNRHYFSFFSREGSILVNNIIMIVVCASVFLGTIYPLLVEVFSNNKISVGEPYFNSVTIPIMIPAILVMGMGPMLSWGKVDIIRILTKSLPSILFAAVISSIFFWIYGSYNMVGLAGIFLAFWIISNILLTTIQQLIVKNKEVAQNNIPKYSIEMITAHLGVALLILGITGSSIWQKEKIIRMKVNDKTSIHNYNIVFKEISEVTGPNYVALQGNFWVYNNKKNIITKLKPENRFYPVTNNSTTEASIHTNLSRDLYVVIGDGDLNRGWIVRIYYNPLVVWIWIGAFAIFLGGLFSMKNNLKKLKCLSI
jgi:cytochrome c-type biogenesis protein CcmF